MTAKTDRKPYNAPSAVKLVQHWRQRAKQNMLAYIADPDSSESKVALWEASILENCAFQLDSMFP